jgi:hypothetical protein
MLLIAGAVVAAPVAANTLTDPEGDFLATYIGPQNGDLDVLSVTAEYSGTFVRLSSVHAGAIGTTVGAPHVWGVDRGAGTARFVGGSPSVGAGVLFDSVVVLRADGTGQVTTFPAMGSPTTTPLAAGAIMIDGNMISVMVPRALLPSRGFAVADYGYNLWPRAPGMGNAFISDFAPDDSTFKASFVPEPASWALLIAGFGFVGAAMRRRRSAIA